jgi:CheY-like chemotaxis protein
MAPPMPLRMLIVDDAPGFTRGLARLLRRNGATVATATKGHLALAQLQAQDYDVILCGLRMPGLDGPDFYATLCRQHPDLRQRVIVLTGDTCGTDSTAFLAQCGQPWVYNPCTVAVIRSAIQQIGHAGEVPV